MILRLLIHPATKDILAATILALLTCNLDKAQDQTPASEMSISDIMKEAHKGPKPGEPSLVKRVAKNDGSATAGDQQRLLDMYKSMAAQEPPVGDAAEWKEKNDLLIGAVEGIIAGEEGASGKLRKASNCMKCHKAHKPD